MVKKFEILLRKNMQEASTIMSSDSIKYQSMGQEAVIEGTQSEKRHKKANASIKTKRHG